MPRRERHRLSNGRYQGCIYNEGRPVYESNSRYFWFFFLSLLRLGKNTAAFHASPTRLRKLYAGRGVIFSGLWNAAAKEKEDYEKEK